MRTPLLIFLRAFCVWSGDNIDRVDARGVLVPFPILARLLARTKRAKSLSFSRTSLPCIRIKSDGGVLPQSL